MSKIIQSKIGFIFEAEVQPKLKIIIFSSLNWFSLVCDGREPTSPPRPKITSMVAVLTRRFASTTSFKPPFLQHCCSHKTLFLEVDGRHTRKFDSKGTLCNMYFIYQSCMLSFATIHNGCRLDQSNPFLLSVHHPA